MKIAHYVKKVYSYMSSLTLCKKLLFLRDDGFLKDSGWINSIRLQKPVDADNNPLPWFTYSLIDFLDQFLQHGMLLFEYGSGYSSLFFAKRVKHVYTVEYNQYWLLKLNIDQVKNITAYHVPLDKKQEYIQAIKEPGVLYDVIIIDGRFRLRCLKEAEAFLNPNGIIILDDVQREYYKPGIDYLIGKGYRKMQFRGMVPSSLEVGHSIILYKSLSL